jgi:glycine cleavage system aminomethyltransferase T
MTTPLYPDAPPSPSPAVPSRTADAGDGARPVVLDYGDPAAEYAALRTAALAVDRTHRARWTFRGAKARDTIAGLVTNDVLALAPGHGCYAAALTPKGKIIADVRILAVGDGEGVAPAGDGGPLDGAALLVDVPPRAAEGWAQMIRKFVNPRATAYRDVSGALRAFGVYGTRARDVVAEALGIAPSALAALAPYAHATVASEGATLLVVHVPDLGLDGFELFVPAGAFDAAWGRVADAGARPAGSAPRHRARRGGRPEWGVDIDEATIAQEANLDELHAISYTKGVLHRAGGRGARALPRAREPAPARARAPGTEPLPRGGQLVDDAGKPVGEVRSAVVSPRLGGVALAMVRREVPLGATLRVMPRPAAPADGADAPDAPAASGDGAPEPRLVTVATLPFPL